MNNGSSDRTASTATESSRSSAPSTSPSSSSSSSPSGSGPQAYGPGPQAHDARAATAQAADAVASLHAPAGGQAAPGAPTSPAAAASDSGLPIGVPADPLADARYARFVTDLLGVIAYGELSGFERLSSDARFSPSLADRASLGRLAVQEFEHFELVEAFVAGLGTTIEDAMSPFQASVDAFHERTKPGDWYESLMKAYVIDAFSGDFYRALGDSLDPRTRELISTIDSGDGAAHLQRRLKGALADDPRLASRLALWGRRLVGEALTQAQRVGIEREYLAGLLFANEADQTQHTTALFSQLTRNHSRRMSALGLTA